MSTSIKISNCRFSYMNVFKPRAYSADDKPKFSVVLLIPKENKKTVAKIKKAISDEIANGVENYWNHKKPSGLWNPLQDGDEKADEHPEYEGMYYINAKSDNKPVLVDMEGNDILDQTELYSGCWGNASVSFFPFNNKLKGVAVGLNGITKTKDDTPFGGGMTRDSIIDSLIGDDDEDEDDF